MKRDAREFIRSTTTLLDHVLTKLTPEEQHDLLDALAGGGEERLDEHAGGVREVIVELQGSARPS